MDQIVKCLTEQSRIRLIISDVTITSKALEARHLSGPVASSVLGEALAAVALLSADTGSGEEAWMMRMQVDGAIGGFVVEATGEGLLRGFTNKKTMDALDGTLPVRTEEALGDSGQVQIASSVPGRILNQAVLDVSPPYLRYALARFYNHSMQIPTGCCIHVVADDAGLLSARACMIQRMDDSDQDMFIQMLETLEKGALDSFMQARSWPASFVASFQELFSCDPLAVRETRSLAFGCRCSKEKILGVLESLTLPELDDAIAAGKHQDVVCHMCGHTYTADVADLRGVRAAVAKGQG